MRANSTAKLNHAEHHVWLVALMRWMLSSVSSRQPRKGSSPFQAAPRLFLRLCQEPLSLLNHRHLIYGSACRWSLSNSYVAGSSNDYFWMPRGKLDSSVMVVTINYYLNAITCCCGQQLESWLGRFGTEHLLYSMKELLRFRVRWHCLSCCHMKECHAVMKLESIDVTSEEPLGVHTRLQVHDRS